MYEYQAKLIRVVDGDTVHLKVDLGLNIFVELSCRLARINAPEMATAEGKQAKMDLTRLLWADPNPVLIVKTTKDKQEKYGRYLVDIITKDGCVNDLMVERKSAVYYDGGKR